MLCYAMLILRDTKSVNQLYNYCKMISNFSHHSTLKFKTLCFLTPQNPNRLSCAVRLAAQDSLFDYLHSTRGFHYIDAEHISKNSPNFLVSLLSKVHQTHEIETSQAVSKFLRYNPINEFEPFLESLGLSGKEVENYLPRSLMFVFDDKLMLENFHVLCDFGVPRCKIGKIYKEANEVFSYKDGVLGFRIKAYEELGLSKSTVIKLISCSPLLLVGENVDVDFVKVIEKLKKLGFGDVWIGGYLSDKSSYCWNRMAETIGFLVSLGCSDEKMSVLFRENPTLLFEGSGKKLYVLVGSLLKSGIKRNEIYSLFLQDPQILSAKCVKNLFEVMCFLFEIGLESVATAKIVSSNINLLAMHNIKRPRTVMRNLKVDKAGLCRILNENPLDFLRLASKTGSEQLFLRRHVTFLDKTTFLLSLGFVENSEEMTKASKQFRGRGDQLQERFDCLVNAGLDPNDVRAMVNTAPSMLNQSKAVLEKKIDCLRNYLKYPVDSISVFPSYLCYDMRRINIRFSMYVWLRERGVVKPMLTLSTILACSDKRFERYFVDKDPEGPAMWEQLKQSMHPS